MPHPFFDAPKYPWHRPDAGRFHKNLSNSIKIPAQIDLYYRRSAIDPPDITLPQPSSLIWKEALENLTVVRGLEKLCEILDNDPSFKNNLEMKQNIRDVINAKSFDETQKFSDNLLVLNRELLRDKLALLAPDTSPVKVLLIRGGIQSGKSHGRYLFERAAYEQGAQPIYIFDGLVATVDEVLNELFCAWGEDKLDKIPPRNTTEDAWYKNVLLKLKALASEKGKPLWIAVDDLGITPGGGPLLDPQIRHFFEQFALHLLSPVFRPWFRLLLIHYPDGPVPTKWKRELWSEDRTNEADIGEEDVAKFLKLWSIAQGIKMLEDDVVALAADVISRAEIPLESMSGVPRLQRIHDTLTDTLQNHTNRQS